LKKSWRILAVFAAVHVILFVVFLLDWKFLDTIRTDVDLYFQYGYRVLTGRLSYLGFLNDYPAYGQWLGHLPYRDFMIEYPPFSIVPFVLPAMLPLLFPGNFANELELYRNAFWLQMLVLDLAGLWLFSLAFRRFAPSLAMWKGLAIYTLCLAAVGTIVAQRYDLLPAVLTLLSLYAYAQGRHKLAGLSLALAVVAKLYPIVIVPILMVAYWRRRAFREMAWAGAAFVATMAAVIVPVVLSSGTGLLESLLYQGERGLQVESLYAVPYELAAFANLFLVRTRFDHQSVHINAIGSDVIASLSFVILVGALLLVYWSYFRQSKDSAEGEDSEELTFRFAFLAILAFMLTSKVFSPQFMIWLLPLIPLLQKGRSYFTWAVYIVAGALTMYVFPHSYPEFLSFQFLPVLGLAARNGLMVVLFVSLLRPELVRVPALERWPLPRRLANRLAAVPLLLGRPPVEAGIKYISPTIPAEPAQLPEEMAIGEGRGPVWPE
jgi:hypothetical protein